MGKQRIASIVFFIIAISSTLQRRGRTKAVRKVACPLFLFAHPRCWRFTAVLGFGESLDGLRGDGSRRRWQNLMQHRLLRRAWLAVG